MLGKLFIVCLVAFLTLSNCRNTATSKPDEPAPVLTPSPVEKKEDGFLAKIKFLSDGDSFVIYRGEETQKVRIYGIDAPELNQDAGKESRNNLKKIIGRSEVFLVPKAKDKFGRIVAQVLVNNQDIGQMQILDGYAWAYRPEWNDLDYETAENVARTKQKGLWSLSDPQEPWEWRRNHPRTINK